MSDKYVIAALNRALEKALMEQDENEALIAESHMPFPKEEEFEHRFDFVIVYKRYLDERGEGGRLDSKNTRRLYENKLDLTVEITELKLELAIKYRRDDKS